MIDFARAMTDDETRAAAHYFSSMPWTPWIKVIEDRDGAEDPYRRSNVSEVRRWRHEPIGNRIIETPVDMEATESLRDPRSAFIAYVPVGSIKKGEALVMKGGGGKTTQCTICHAADLQGLGPCRDSQAARQATSCGNMTFSRALVRERGPAS